jgi:hypothetical protein
MVISFEIEPLSSHVGTMTKYMAYGKSSVVSYVIAKGL